MKLSAVEWTNYRGAGVQMSIYKMDGTFERQLQRDVEWPEVAEFGSSSPANNRTLPAPRPEIRSPHFHRSSCGLFDRASKPPHFLPHHLIHLRDHEIGLPDSLLC